MEESKTQSTSHIPLVSRLDHLDLIMKSLEGKQNLLKGGSKSSDERQSLPLDLAVREAYFKGSLMDRVAFLERRLFQLCLEMESSSTSSGSGNSSSQTSGSDASATQVSKSNINPNQLHKHHSNYNPQVIKETSRKEEGKKNSEPVEQKLGKNKTNAEEKRCKSGRKRAPPKWPHLKILGC